MEYPHYEIEFPEWGKSPTRQAMQDKAIRYSPFGTLGASLGGGLSGNFPMMFGLPPTTYEPPRHEFTMPSWLRDDWYWYVALTSVVALGVASAWL